MSSIGSGKSTSLAQNSIDLFLNVWNTVNKTHGSDLEKLLFSVRVHREREAIFHSNSPLVEERNGVSCADSVASKHEAEHFALLRDRVLVLLYNTV